MRLDRSPLVLVLAASACALAQIPGPYVPPANQPAPDPAAEKAAAERAAIEAAALAAKTTTPLAHVETRGTGPVHLILIPGLGCDWTVFDAFMTRNAERYTMHAVTLPGFGGSAPPPYPPAGVYFRDGAWMENAERAVAELIAAKKLEKPVVAGHSMGGHIAMRIASSRPGLVASAIAIDGMPAYPLGGPGAKVNRDERESIAIGMYGGMSNAPDNEWKTQQRQWVSDMVTDRDRARELGEMAASVPKLTTCAYMAELMAQDITADVKASETPILLIGAIPKGGMYGSSVEQLRAMWEEFANESKKASVTIFHRTRHFVMDDAPAELDRSIEQWIKGEPVEGKPEAKAEGAE